MSVFPLSLSLTILTNIVFYVIDYTVLLFEKYYILLLEHAMPSLMVAQHKIVLIYIVTFFFVHVLYINISIFYIYAYRSYIHHMCDCNTLSLYTLVYILYSSSQFLHITSMSPQHTNNTALHIYSEYRIKIVN